MKRTIRRIPSKRAKLIKKKIDAQKKAEEYGKKGDYKKADKYRAKAEKAEKKIR